MVLIFEFWDISFKVCNNYCIMPSLGKQISSILLGVLKINETVNFEDDYFVRF